IMITKDEGQQWLFVKFIKQFLLNIKQDKCLFYKQFLSNINEHLTMIGYYLSCLLTLYENTGTLDYRLDILETLWILVYIHDNEYEIIVGQILSCFLPGLIKTLASVLFKQAHHRLIEASLIVFSYLIRISVRLSTQNSEIKNLKSELIGIYVTRNEEWIRIVDNHIETVLKRLSHEYSLHESLNVQCALTTTMIISHQLPIIICQTSSASDTYAFIKYQTLFREQILNSTENVALSDHLFLQCQTDLFQLCLSRTAKSGSNTATLNERRWRLQLFAGYYQFIHRQIKTLFDLDTFCQQFLEFVLDNLDFQLLIKDNLLLLNSTSIKINMNMSNDEYYSVYKLIQPDVHNDIQRIFHIFLNAKQSNVSGFLLFFIEKLNETDNQDDKMKFIYLLSIVIDTLNNNIEIEQHCQNTIMDQMITLLTTYMYDDDNRGRNKKARKSKDYPISLRNLTIYLVLKCLLSVSNYLKNDDEYHQFLIDYIPLLLICCSSKYTIVHQTAFRSLQMIAREQSIEQLLSNYCDYVIDIALKKLRTSSIDGYIILIEFSRIGRASVINQPIMTHVIEYILLELECLPSIDVIRMIFQFLSVFCQQVALCDNNHQETFVQPQQLVDDQTNDKQTLVDFALDLGKQHSKV
ncbi:unnamed protein product, partial [Didymodactylos carnosus]